MPFSGGTFQALPPPTYPAVTGQKIRADYFNAVINDIITGLTAAYASPNRPLTAPLTVGAIWKWESDGRVWGSALHNNANPVTGTVNQYIASGTYTPAAVAVLNVSAVLVTKAQWIRVGNVVTVSGLGNVTPASTSAFTSWTVSLPIASTLSSADGCGGGQAGFTAHWPLRVVGNGATVEMDYIPDNVSAQQFTFTFTYEVK